jgi:3-deoxy-D-manno-octulosonic-acid transferase
MLDASGVAWRRRTALNAESQSAESVADSPGEASAARVLLVDVVGELGAWWGTAQIAFVGGSMGSRGGQNMIEPAAYGAAVCFGPNTRNFRDIVATMLARDAAVVAHDREELTRFVGRCLQDPPYAAALGHRAKLLVTQQQGATERTFRLLAGLLEEPRPATTGKRSAA